MKTKIFSFLILFIIISIALFDFVPIVKANPSIEEVYTNAFDATYVAWIEVGSSPYLHNTDTDYIYRLTSKTLTYKEGRWSFPNSAGSGTINSVKLRFEDYRTNLAGDAGVDVYVWDGTSWVYAGYLSLHQTSYAWEELDVSSILNSWDKINGAKVYLQTWTATLTDTIYVRRLTRKVDYSAVSKSWNTAETWRLNIYTLKWFLTESWRINAYTLNWFNAESWKINLHNFAWFTSEIWRINAHNYSWFASEIWQIGLHAFTWFNVELWMASLHNYSWFTTEVWKTDLHVLNWFVSELWKINLHNYSWFNIETWKLNLHTLAWYPSEIWNLSLHGYEWFMAEAWKIATHAFGWFSAEVWQAVLHTVGWYPAEMWLIELSLPIIDSIAFALGSLGFFLSCIPLLGDDEKTKALGATALILCISGLAFSMLYFDYALPIASLGFILALASMALASTKKD